jgi:hypothetical protein
MARDIHRRLDKIERLILDRFSPESSPVYLRAHAPIPEGLDPARVIFTKRVLIDPPEREAEQLPEMQIEPEVERQPPRNFCDPIRYPKLGIVCYNQRFSG